MRYEETAIRIREALNDLNMSQQELADKSHVAKASISHYVLGHNKPNNKSAYMMAEVLGVNPVWLMGLDAPKHVDVDIESRDMEKAVELYARYAKAIPEIQAAVDSLLKGPKSDS
jgi:transcriptional regulator with XRE-family HTH domain